MRYYLALKADAGSVPCSTTNHMKRPSTSKLMAFFS